MGLWQARFNDDSLCIVEIVGWNHQDVIIKELKTDLVTAMGWPEFLFYFKEVEPFTCDTSDYMGADLDRVIDDHTL